MKLPSTPLNKSKLFLGFNNCLNFTIKNKNDNFKT